MEPERALVVYAALAVAVIALILMWRLSRGGARPVAAGAGPAAPSAASDELLLKFVVDSGGQRRGETVAVDGDRLILKTPDGFASLASAQLKPEGATLRIEGDVDWDDARKAGEAWRTRSYKEITYSPDEVPQEPS
jgi:hypothetical protein